MRFLFSDYLLLTAANFSDCSISGILFKMCETIPSPPDYEGFCLSLSKLNGAGYMDGLNISEKGKNFFSRKKKFLESKKRYFSRMENEFVNQDCNLSITDTDVNKEEYEAVISKIKNEYNNDSVFTFHNGLLTVGCEGINNENTDELAEDEIEAAKFLKVSISNDQTEYLVCSLVDAAYSIVFENPQAKICLYGDKEAFVLAITQDEKGIKVNLRKILFNKKSFKGKTGGSLDYAQCSDPLVEFRCSRYVLASSMIFMCAYLENFENFPYDKIAKIRGELV